MSNIINNPLEAIIAQASQLPKTNVADLYKKRFEGVGASNKTVILIDCSGSMATVCCGSRKIDTLKEALTGQKPGAILIAFSTGAKEIPNVESVPDPSGSTELHDGLRIAGYHKPRHTLVISDGRPDDANLALFEANQITGTISTLFIGDDDDKGAIAFMRELAGCGCGVASVCDLRRDGNKPQLRGQIKALIPG